MCRNTKELHGYHDLLRQNLLSLDPPKQNPACLDDHQGLGVKTPELQKWEMCSSFSYCKDTDISWKLWAGACYFRRKYLLAGRNPVFILPNAFRCKKKKKNVLWPFWESCSSPFVYGKPWKAEQRQLLGAREVSFSACFCSALAEMSFHLSFTYILTKMVEPKVQF